MACPQHFHIHDFNEVNLFQTVRGLTFFIFRLHVYLYQYAPFPIPSSPSQGEKSFFQYLHTPSLIPHVSRFLCSPFQSDCLSPVQGLPLSLCTPHKDSLTKSHGREKETIKGKGWWWLEGW